METARPRTYDVLGILLKFLAYPSDVQGKYCLVEAVVPPGAGAPPNHHADETEAFYVIEGRVRFHIAGEEREVGPGTHVAIPDGAVHAFTALGDAPAKMLILNAPGRMHETFFTRLGTPLAEGTTQPPPPAGPPDLARVMAAAEASGMTILAPAEA